MYLVLGIFRYFYWKTRQKHFLICGETSGS